MESARRHASLPAGPSAERLTRDPRPGCRAAPAGGGAHVMPRSSGIRALPRRRTAVAPSSPIDDAPAVGPLHAASRHLLPPLLEPARKAIAGRRRAQRCRRLLRGRPACAGGGLRCCYRCQMDREVWWHCGPSVGFWSTKKRPAHRQPAHQIYRLIMRGLVVMPVAMVYGMVGTGCIFIYSPKKAAARL